MKLFGEEVRHTSTNSPLNVLQVEGFEEIFFDVFEVELNNTKLPLEKISSYKGNPVVNLPIVVEGEEVLYPFVLIKGPPEILFNESNTDLPIDDEVCSFEIDDEEVLSESKQEILDQIEKAKEKATKVIKRVRLIEATQLSETAKKNNKALKNTLEKARENLVEEFITVSNKIREELVNESRQGYSEMKETLDNKLVDICENLESQLKDNFKDASKIFDNNIKTLVKELYSETVYPKLEKDLNDIAFQIVEKVGEIETTLDKKLDTKAEKTLVEGVSKELSAIQKANIELNDNINKGVNKALSRAGNVKTLVEKIDKEINEKISFELTNIESYFDERIQNIQEKTFDITEESRKYIIDLVNKSKRDLLEEIAKIPKEKPVEYIIESKSKDPEKVNLDKLKKEYDVIIHNKFENYKTDLRKYISVYSGGGSVAQQFADGGTMNGDLTVVGTISASNYLGIPGGSGDDVVASTKVRSSSAAWDSTYNTVNTLSSSWGGGITGDYLSLSGGTVSGSISAIGLSTSYIQFDINATSLPNREGLLQWNSTEQTLDLGLDGGNIVQQIGEELFIKVYNDSGSTIPNGSPVYFNGRQGNRPKIYLAQSNLHSTSSVMGITTQDIPDNSNGRITTFGYVRQIKTNYSGSGDWGNAWTEGDKLYVSKTVAGQLTNIEPSAPHHSDIVGEVGVVGGSGIGSILVSVRHHQALEDLSDINGTALTTNGQFPVWDNDSGYFDFTVNINDIKDDISASTKVRSSSANWDSDYNTVNTLSANWQNTYTSLSNYAPLSSSLTVQLDSVSGGEVLVYDSSISAWKNSDSIGVSEIYPALNLSVFGGFKVISEGSVDVLTVDWGSASVGIGTDTPVAKLDVNGSLNVVGDAEFSGVVLGSDIGNYNNVINEPLSTRTLGLADANQYIRFSNISGCLVTVAPQSAVSWVQGTTIYFRRVTGAGALSFASNGVTINNSAISSITAGQTFAIKRVGSDSWDFI